MTRIRLVVFTFLAVVVIGLVLIGARENPRADFDFGTGLVVRH